MPAPSNDEIDYLLSKGRLGGSQRRRILHAVLESSRESPWRRWRARLAWSAGGLALATGAAAVLLLGAPGREEPAGTFRAKGSEAAPLISVSCLGGALSSCPPGSRVAFALEGGQDAGGYLTAYADAAPSGERIWYLTNQSVGAPGAGGAPRVVSQAALIGDGQPSGRYRVHALFTRRPAAREALAALPPGELIAHVEIELVVP